MAQVILPELGEGVKKAVVACWHFNEGDVVSKDDDLVELVTDKATFNVPSPEAGILSNIKYKEREEADIGVVLADIVV
ncbi:MAG: pyruvate dehydrogenase E2 component (dihydrolipoamide acetyltransferase) [Candidatus Omnitrophota bacterium]|jgi:pyruvate dehydrogenase E2 component (dihydrolipoamide acetyltransferase)